MSKVILKNDNNSKILDLGVEASYINQEDSLGQLIDIGLF